MKNIATLNVSLMPDASRRGRRLMAVAALALGALAAGHASAFDNGVMPAAELGQRTLTRAEVIADLNLWRQAGVDRHAELATYYQANVGAYEQALAQYLRLRNSPAFAAEVAKVLGQDQNAEQVSAR